MMETFIDSTLPFSSLHTHIPANMSKSFLQSPIFLDQPSLTTFFVGSGDKMATAKPPRVRRKSSTGLDQVKHRRTRSGCFTCRMRRVKVSDIILRVYVTL